MPSKITEPDKTEHQDSSEAPDCLDPCHRPTMTEIVRGIDEISENFHNVSDSANDSGIPRNESPETRISSNSLAASINSLVDADRAKGPSWNQKLREAREKAKLSRPQLARRLASTGVTIGPEAIKKHESGNAYPKPQVRQGYAKLYGEPEEFFFPMDKITG